MSRINDIAVGVLHGDMRALARGISLVEDGGDEAERLLTALTMPAKRARLVGITGPPGAGKSTLTGRLAEILQQRGEKIALLLIDPSSPFSGGAILGDRIRMHGLAGKKSVYIRSLGSRGSLGGLSRAVPGVVELLQCFGFDTVLIETVGTGQAETDVVEAVDSVVVVTVPGLGDDVQAMKAGIIEIADIFVVNKADREGADRTVRQLEEALKLGPKAVPIIKTTALTGEGVATLVAELDRHYDLLSTTGELEARRARRTERAIYAYALSILASRLEERAQRQLLATSAQTNGSYINIYQAGRRLAEDFYEKEAPYVREN